MVNDGNDVLNVGEWRRWKIISHESPSPFGVELPDGQVFQIIQHNPGALRPWQVETRGITKDRKVGRVGDTRWHTERHILECSIPYPLDPQ